MTKDYKRFDTPDGDSVSHQEHLSRKSSLKIVAFCAVVFSTVSVAACFITLPLVFDYVQRLQANVRSEVDFCKVGVSTFTTQSC
jgi:hypothetical protein